MQESTKIVYFFMRKCLYKFDISFLYCSENFLYEHILIASVYFLYLYTLTQNPTI